MRLFADSQFALVVSDSDGLAGRRVRSWSDTRAKSKRREPALANFVNNMETIGDDAEPEDGAGKINHLPFAQHLTLSTYYGK